MTTTIKINTLLVLLILINLTLSCKKSDFDSEEFTIKIGNDKRKYLLHESKSSRELYPLVIALHGGTGSPLNIEEQSLLSETADQEGFYVCYPEGKHRTWNAGGCCGKAAKDDVDDVKFISELIDYLLSQYPIDRERIYVTGMSNGGFMSYRLACALSHKIAAIAPVAATMNFEPCNPEHSIPIIHFHSYKDTSVPYLGGIGDGISDHYNPPLFDILNEWSIYNECSSSDTVKTSYNNYDHFTWNACDSIKIIELYITRDGGHSWPNGTKPRSKADEPSTAINANQLMWQFFQKHRRIQ